MQLSLLLLMLLLLCILLKSILSVDSGDVLITVTAVDVVSDAGLAAAAAGAISSAVKALYDSRKMVEISVLLEKR